MESLTNLHAWILERGDKRTEKWLLAYSPVPILSIYLIYLMIVLIGPKIMKHREPFSLKYILVVYNIGMQILSTYMCYEFTVTAYLSGYSLVCQPVDYSNDHLALRMANVSWWFFFSKVVELADTVFFILRKKNNQISFLHVYHHSTMILNWWIAVKYVPGGQAFFMGILNSAVHVVMYGYYGLAALGPHMQKYLWWKKYITKLQLSQFVVVLIHTVTNIYVAKIGPGCDFPQFLNYIVTCYALSLIVLFSNFFYQSYVAKARRPKNAVNGKDHSNGISKSNKIYTNGVNNHKNGSATKRVTKSKKYY